MTPVSVSLKDVNNASASAREASSSTESAITWPFCKHLLIRDWADEGVPGGRPWLTVKLVRLARKRSQGELGSGSIRSGKAKRVKRSVTDNTWKHCSTRLQLVARMTGPVLGRRPTPTTLRRKRCRK